MHINKSIIVGIVIIMLASGLISIHFIQKSKPQNIIENKLKLKLPSTSKIINYDYDKFGGYFDTKILIENQSVDYVKEQLSRFFDGTSKQDITKMPNFINTCSWWDLDKNSIETYYSTFTSEKKIWFGHSPKSHEVWVFISKDKNGDYYLYISY